jgi:hypothetical protein
MIFIYQSEQKREGICDPHNLAELSAIQGWHSGGANPAELPAQRRRRLKTAKAQGLRLPDKLLALADDVIE